VWRAGGDGGRTFFIGLKEGINMTAGLFERKYGSGAIESKLPPERKNENFSTKVTFSPTVSHGFRWPYA